MLELVAIAFGLVSVILLMPDVFNAEPPDGGGMNESLSGERGRVVPAGTGANHPLWVEVRGELWRARSSSGDIPPGTEVELLETDGMIAVVKPAPSQVPKPRRRRDFGGMRSLWWGLAAWAASCGFCWLALGSPLYAVVGVPTSMGLVLASFAGFGDG